MIVESKKYLCNAATSSSEFLQGLGFFISNLMNPLLISVLSTKLVFSTQMAEQSLSSSLSAHVGQESFCFDTIPAPCTELARGHC